MVASSIFVFKILFSNRGQSFLWIISMYVSATKLVKTKCENTLNKEP